MTQLNTDICIIGAGSGGLSVAAGAVQMGAKVILIEQGKMGGDCLNYGCIPSKSIIAASKAAHAAKHSFQTLGVECKDITINFQKVNQHIHNVIDSIAPMDSEERFSKLGVKVLKTHASFINKNQVSAGKYIINAKYFVIATGSAAKIPNIDGLNSTPYLTNETIFGLKTCPRHILVLGTGPIGCELSQAFSRLGSQVTLLGTNNILPREENFAVNILKEKLLHSKINIIENAEPLQFAHLKNGDVRLRYYKNKAQHQILASHLLIATGRNANIESLNLKAAGITTQNNAIKVDQRLRTTNKKIFAIGDVRGGLQFTHLAAYDAGIIIRNMLFKIPAKTNYKFAPRVTYTDPEIASVGLNQKNATKQFGPNIKILTANMEHNDRAKTERNDYGKIQVITTKKGKILGTTICAKNAGELLLPWIMALNDGKKISAMASYVVPYPTLSEISKRAAGEYFTPMLFSNKTQKIVRFILKWLS